jgi:elongation factor G
VKQTGGRGHFGHVVLALEPGEAGSGIEFTDKVRGGSVPQEYIPAVEQGVREAAEAGVLAGYPMTDIQVTLLDGSFHEVDSSKMAFKMAGSMGFKEGVRRAKPVLLEPVMKIEVVVPDEAVGDVTGDLSSRRADIGALEQRGGNTQIVRATAPLSEMFGYATDLRSMTQGRGVFSMEFHHYRQVEKRVTESLLEGAF